MHVMHFCGALKGGTLSAIAVWTRQQIAAGHRVSLVYSPLRDPVESFRGDLPPQVALVALEVGREIHPASDLRAIRTLAGILSRMQPDVIHLHSSKAGAIGRIAARLAGVPAIYSTHGVAFLRTDVALAVRAVFYGLEWLLGVIGTVTVACSASELKVLRAIPGRKLAIPNGVDPLAMPRPAAALSHEGLEIVLCGRITAQKNPALACRIAGASPPGWRWTWLGDGDLQDMVHSQGRIAVAGWLPRAEALARIGAADVMVHTSSWEGMSIAVLEAMALGVPVVATNVVGNRDLIVPGETGFVAGDEEAFLTALSLLAQAPEMRRRMGDAARARVARDYDQEKLGARWIALYEQVRT